MPESEKTAAVSSLSSDVGVSKMTEIAGLLAISGWSHFVKVIAGVRVNALLCRFWDGIYVLYTYAAQRKTSQAVQKLLSTPVVGQEKNVLRHMTFITQ